MGKNNLIRVQVAFARQSQQQILTIDIPIGSTIKEAIIQSNISDTFPEIDLSINAVGVYGQLKALTDEVYAGDRIEIYQPLVIHPMEARRRRAKNQKQKNSLI